MKVTCITNEYEGQLNYGPSLPKHVKRAWRIYWAQRARCGNKNYVSYKYYGMKGISVEYTIRQFVYWYLKEIKKYGPRRKKPVVGRIDHSLGYSFTNIKLESRTENANEVIGRCAKNYSMPVVVTSTNGKLLFKARSMIEAAKKSGVSYGGVWKQCRGKVESPRTSYRFRFGGINGNKD